MESVATLSLATSRSPPWRATAVYSKGRGRSTPFLSHIGRKIALAHVGRNCVDKRLESVCAGGRSVARIMWATAVLLVTAGREQMLCVYGPTILPAGGGHLHLLDTLLPTVGQLYSVLWS